MAYKGYKKVPNNNTPEQPKQYNKVIIDWNDTSHNPNEIFESKQKKQKIHLQKNNVQNIDVTDTSSFMKHISEQYNTLLENQKLVLEQSRNNYENNKYLFDHQRNMSDFQKNAHDRQLLNNEQMKIQIADLSKKITAIDEKIKNDANGNVGSDSSSTSSDSSNNKSLRDGNKSTKNDINLPPGNVLIKVQDNSPQTNPFGALFEHILNMSDKKKEKEVDPDENDNYDNEEIYCNENDDIDNNDTFEKINNIADLIAFGEQYEKIFADDSKGPHKKTFKKTNGLKPRLKVGMSKKQHNSDLNDESKYDFETFEYDGKQFGINLKTVVKLINPLKKLARMIGMQKVKDDIFDMIIYFLQGFEKRNKNMLHSVIEGPPGVGKTQLGKIMAQIYCGLGIIESSRFKYVKATDLMGDHIGATKHMTQAAIDEANGGVLFIDEAYALGSSGSKDPYGKECIDTINFNLSEKKSNLIVIVAGYTDDLDKYFFSLNPGLARRFPYRFKVDSYTAIELMGIFIDKLKKNRWKLRNEVTMEKLETFFKTHKKDFPFFGGDIENMLKSCQFAHSKRMIGKNPLLRGKLSMEDLVAGLEKFKSNKRTVDKIPNLSMYM